MATTDSETTASDGAGAALRITVLTAVLIAVADMVGTGVFTSLGYQLFGLNTGFALLMLWVVGGVVALCGALSYAELAGAFPRSGGEYNYLSRVYHPAVGFMSGWLSATVGFAAPIAAAALALEQYFWGVFPDWRVGLGLSESSPPYLGVLVCWLITGVHLAGLKPTRAFQEWFTFFKIALILGLIVMLFALGEPQPISFAPQEGVFTELTSSAFAISLVFVMYSYSGWNASSYIAGEMRNPQRDVPRALVIGTLIVIALYVTLNFAFLYTTPFDAMRGKPEVALAVGDHVFGATGGAIVGGLICFGLISTISALIWLGPRVTKTMGEDLPALSLFARTSPGGAPSAAIVLQLAIVTVLALTQTFESVIQFIGFSLTLSSFVAVLGVIVLRFTQPELPRAFRVPLFPIVPGVFLAVAGWILFFQLREKPTESLLGLGLLAVGLCVYALSVAASRRPRAGAP